MAITAGSDVLTPSHGDGHRGYRLAAGTELIGEYQDSGLETPRYLVQRADGQVMQLPHLLYRLAGSLDGRDAGQVAADLSAELGRDLTTDQVSFLVEERLRPVGIIAPEDGDADGPRAGEPTVQSDLLLALRYRVGVVPAEVSWRVAGFFRPLFLRPVWTAALAAFVAVLATIVVRGDLLAQVLAGVDQIVRAPELLLAIYVLTVAAGAFHEFGHVTACRYGGARPGDMGIGLYVVWPAFYSTVTDSYRLSRVGRLRTDLGGVYFNVVALTGLGLVYLHTSEPWLLIALLGKLGETLWQFMPAIRLDGYYVLADLVGVPDLFGYLWPALVSLLPGRPMHPKVRELRPRARRVIVTWVALVFPTLLVYLVAFLVALPHVLPVVWRAFLDYLGTLDTAVRTGDVVRTAVGVFELFLLVLPWVGTVLIAGLVGKQLRQVAAARWGWEWARPEPWAAVRGAVARATVGVLAVALVWRVAAVATSAPASAAEARITAGALGILQLGRETAPAVAAGEGVVREQLVAYARATGAFGRHADALVGGRELAVLACAVLVVCLLTLARACRWRLWAVALPLVSVAAMGPAVTTLATVGPGVVGAAWTAAGGTLLVQVVRHRHGRHRRPRLLGLHRPMAVLGAAAVLVGIGTAPFLFVPLAVGAALVILDRGRHAGRSAHWAPLALGAFTATGLAALAVPVLLQVPGGTALGRSEEQVLLVVGVLVAAGGLAIRDLRWAAAVTGSVVVLAAVPAPGADAVLPLVVGATALLGGLIVQGWAELPAPQRPHPLLRAALAVPVAVLVVVGALFLPARAPDLPDEELGAWVTDPASPVTTLAVPQSLWTEPVHEGVPPDRLRSAATGSSAQATWYVVVGESGPDPRTRVVFGSGDGSLAVLGPG